MPPIYGSCFNEPNKKETHSIDENAIKNIEYMIIWAEHCVEESQLLWRFSFLLRLVK